MSSLEERDQQSVAERLSEETGRPVEDYEYDGHVPDLDELETVSPEDVCD
ncbi:hypothetical protein [Halorussus halobius]|nr:hypothetical protein [Halorussus halobius]